MTPILIFYLFLLLQIIFLLPIKDRRSRAHGFPWVTLIIVIINVSIHIWVEIYVSIQPDTSDQPALLALYPFMEVPRLTIDNKGLGALSSLTSTYLHAGWGHLLGNMFFLWFFGRKVEDATGPVHFGLLYTLCGFTSSLLSVTVQSTITSGRVPGLGASGAIFGIMGAYLFLYSDQKIYTLVSTWLAPAIPIVPGFCIIPLPIPIWIPAWVFIVYKLISDALLGQLVLELYKMGETLSLGVGIFAHMGGAIGGMLFIYLFMHPEIFAHQR
jgi:membrane associated rhomboid family serine protease